MAKPRSRKQLRADAARAALHCQSFAWVTRDTVTLGPQNSRVYASSRTACDKKVAEYVGMANSPTISGYSKGILPGRVVGMMAAGRVTCAECARQLAMTTAEHNEYVAVRAERKTAQFNKLKAKQVENLKAKVRAAQDNVRNWEHDALVAQDAYLQGDAYPHLADVLAAALQKQRLACPWSRGNRLWQFSGEPGNKSDRMRDVMCRFCCGIFGRREMGYDYTNDDFVVGGETVNVGRHTTLCALAYLAGAQCPEPHPGEYGGRVAHNPAFDPGVLVT